MCDRFISFLNSYKEYNITTDQYAIYAYLLLNNE